MSLIRSRGNKATEMRLIEIFREHGITGWRRNQPLLGKPDFIFRTERVVVFVDGCFWHGCPKHASLPANNRAFWDKKLSGNEMRDRWVNKMLHLHGWHVVRLWEHELQQHIKQ